MREAPTPTCKVEHRKIKTKDGRASVAAKALTDILCVLNIIVGA